ncbi:MAG: nucleotidyltransferase domain-containing protein [Endozoicomonas sp.]
MRISKEQKADIVELVKRHVSQNARVWLFGSRAKEDARGGDVDLFLEVTNLQDTVARKIDLRLALEDRWGEIKVDILIHDTRYPEQAIHHIARSEGVRLL